MSSKWPNSSICQVCKMEHMQKKKKKKKTTSAMPQSGSWSGLHMFCTRGFSGFTRKGTPRFSQWLLCRAQRRNSSQSFDILTGRHKMKNFVGLHSWASGGKCTLPIPTASPPKSTHHGCVILCWWDWDHLCSLLLCSVSDCLSDTCSDSAPLCLPPRSPVSGS